MLLEYIRNVLIYTVCVPPRNLTYEIDEIPKDSDLFRLKLKQIRNVLRAILNYPQTLQFYCNSCLLISLGLIFTWDFEELKK